MTEVKHTPGPDWGKTEYAARLADLEAVAAGDISLDEAQRRAKERRRQVGLSRASAFLAVSDHVRELRFAKAEQGGS